MEYRYVGKSGLSVSTLALGTMTFGGGDTKFAAIGGLDEDQAARMVDCAIDHGVTLFDTSDNYAQGASENMLGKALGPKRKDHVIASKVFGRTGPGDHDIGLSRRHIIAACEASLRRLGTDWIDLYQIHNHDSLVPVEETLRALDDLVRDGKVRYIGCSNHFAWQVLKALGISERMGLERFVSQQILYSLVYRHAEHELIPAAIDQGLGTLVYSPLAQGYLTGKFRNDGVAGRLSATQQLEGVDTHHAQTIVDELRRIGDCDESGGARSPSQLALRWLVERPGVTSVIVGARSEKQLLDNLAAARTVLSADESTALDRVSMLAPWYPRTAQRVFHKERNPDAP